MFFFVGLEVQRQKVDPGARFGVVPTLKQRAGRLLGVPDHRTARTSASRSATSCIPQGFPGAGTPAPNNNLAPYITPLGRVLANLYPEPNYVDPNNQFNYVYSQLEPTNRIDLKTRFDYNITQNTKAYVRVARRE